MLLISVEQTSPHFLLEALHPPFQSLYKSHILTFGLSDCIFAFQRIQFLPSMTNNDILKKLRIALHLRNDQIVEILQLVNFRMSASELSAFFRNEDHPNYKPCGDQVLRNFLNGLIIHMRGPMDAPKETSSEETND